MTVSQSYPFLKSDSGFTADEGGTGCFVFGDMGGDVDFSRGYGKVDIIKGNLENFSNAHSGRCRDENLCTQTNIGTGKYGTDCLAGEFRFPCDGPVLGPYLSESAKLGRIHRESAFFEIEQSNLQIEVDGFRGETVCFAFFREQLEVLPDVSAGGEIGVPHLVEVVFCCCDIQSHSDIAA